MIQGPKVQVKASHLWKDQFPHLLLTLALGSGVWALAPQGEQTGLLGWPVKYWYYLAAAIPLVHQVLVAAVFRLQLVYGVMTKLFGKADLVIWGILFFPLLGGRAISLLALGLSTQETLPVFAGSFWVYVCIGVLLAVPAIYTLYSVARYFGMARALGGDHFREKYRQMPLVKKGAFAWSSNAMYTFAFLLLWSLALFTRSWPALIIALFQHAYIWVHWYCVEAPDIGILHPPKN
jgi:protein-S-isoprenylcysteine O-methyltransferase Ste14